jgi:hypothetical protein
VVKVFDFGDMDSKLFFSLESYQRDAFFGVINYLEKLKTFLTANETEQNN